jgi:hypothetical protein
MSGFSVIKSAPRFGQFFLRSFRRRRGLELDCMAPWTGRSF